MADEYNHDSSPAVKSAQSINIQNGLDQITVYIQNIDRVFQPIVLDDVSWETERKGAPGKLTFKILKDAVIDFSEGNIVKMGHNGKELFVGYVFSKRQNKDGVITVTAYDQLRYLKNKDVYQFVAKKASEIISAIAADFQLKVGEIEDTEYVIPKYRASNQTLFDTIQGVLDHTLESSKKIFVLYDDFGKLMLKNIDNLHVDILIDAETAEDFNYESTIDKETYNRIKLYYDNKETGKRETYIEQDGANIAKWGTLQLCESINAKKAINPVQKVIALLGLYNRVRRSLSITNAIGDDRVRAGTSVYLNLNLGDQVINNTLMLVESAKHKFSNNQHTMDLTLRGNVI